MESEEIDTPYAPPPVPPTSAASRHAVGEHAAITGGAASGRASRKDQGDGRHPYSSPFWIPIGTPTKINNTAWNAVSPQFWLPMWSATAGSWESMRPER